MQVFGTIKNEGVSPIKSEGSYKKSCIEVRSLEVLKKSQSIVLLLITWYAYTMILGRVDKKVCGVHSEIGHC